MGKVVVIIIRSMFECIIAGINLKSLFLLSSTQSSDPQGETYI